MYALYANSFKAPPPATDPLALLSPETNNFDSLLVRLTKSSSIRIYGRASNAVR